MTAHELARLLLTMPDDRVMLDGYEGGLVDFQRAVERTANVDVRKWSWDGPHEFAEPHDPAAIPIIYLPRDKVTE